MGVRSWVLGIVLLSVAAMSCCASDAERVTVNLTSDKGPVTYRASGFLHAMSRTTPGPELVEVLKPRLLRARAHSREGEAGAFGNYERMNKIGCAVQLVVSDSVGYSQREWWPGDNGDWSRWEGLVESLFRESQAKGYRFQWDIWNEPDGKYFWPHDRDRFFETWRVAVLKLRSLDPRAEIVGPSLARFSEEWLKAFVLYAKEHDVLPDVISWHEMSGQNVHYTTITDRADWMRRLLKDNGIRISRFSINEIIGPHLQTKPGATARYFYELERAGVENAAHACWPDEDKSISNCSNISLNGILTHPERKPRSTWWVYRTYADITGRLVDVRPGATVSGVAGQDRSKKEIRILLGRDGGKEAVSLTPVIVKLDGLNKVGWISVPGKIRVVAQRIPDSGWKHLASPLPAFDREYVVRDCTLDLPLPDFGADDAYAITISPTL